MELKQKGPLCDRKGERTNVTPYTQEARPTALPHLWVRLHPLGEIANLSEPLYQWRQHSGAISATKTAEQEQIARRVADEHLQRLLKQRQYDVVFEGYVRSIGGPARNVDLRQSLAVVTLQDVEMRLRCSHVLAKAECSAKRAVADFTLWLRLLGIWNASRTLLSILCRRAGRRLFGRRPKQRVVSPDKTELNTN